MRATNEELEVLNQTVLGCRLCKRLVTYRERVAMEKVRRFREDEYWGKPLAGFGDESAELLVIGLAPAAHGGNRTGRMFTGDSSGDWLMRALHENGFANQGSSVSRDDGLRLRKAYITSTIRCAPPSNRPLRLEIENCSSYLSTELGLLRKVRVILLLGRVAFESFIRYHYSGNSRGLRFEHGRAYKLGSELTLIASYHPSRQNTQTRRLTWRMWSGIFERIASMLS